MTMEVSDQYTMKDLDSLGANLDLPTWLFENSHSDGPDFWDGAKEACSSTAGNIGSISPAFITSNDIPEWLENDTIDWETIEQQSLMDTSMYFDPSYENKKSSEENSFFKVQPKEVDSFHKFNNEVNYNSSCLYGGFHPKSELEDAGFTELYFDSPDRLENRVQLPDSPISLPDAESDVQFNSINDPLLNYIQSVDNSSPKIIKVPLLEAINQKPVKTIKIKRITKNRPTVSPFNQGSNVKESQKPPVIINLKRICVNKNSPGHTQENYPKLRDIISNDGDELLKELVSNKSTSDEESIQLQVSQENLDHQEIFIPDESSEEEESDSIPVQSRKRRVPFTVTERKLRKKEQNKRAALRYRQKRKEEESTIMTSLQKEEEDHVKLTEKYKSLLTELSFLKKLVKDIVDSKK